MLRQLSRALPVETGCHQCQCQPMISTDNGRTSGNGPSPEKAPFVRREASRICPAAKHFQISRIWGTRIYLEKWISVQKFDLFSFFFILKNPYLTYKRLPLTEVLQWNSETHQWSQGIGHWQCSQILWSDSCVVYKVNMIHFLNFWVTMDLWVSLKSPKKSLVPTQGGFILYPDNNQEGSGNW